MLQPSLAQPTTTSQILSQLCTEPKESVPFPVEGLSDYHNDINYSAEQFVVYAEESWKGHLGHSAVLSEGPTIAKALTGLSYKGPILTGIYRRYSSHFLFFFWLPNDPFFTFLWVHAIPQGMTSQIYGCLYTRVFTRTAAIMSRWTF